MKNLLLTALCLLAGFSSFAQIYMADSTVEVVAYWNKGEKKNYLVSYSEIRIAGKDTTLKQSMSYEVEINILDSTESFFETEWAFNNFQSPEMDPIESDEFDSTESINVLIKTNEFGTLSEIINWDELEEFRTEMKARVKEQIQRSPEIERYKEQIKADPKLAEFFELHMDLAAKDPLQIFAMPEIRSFHAFHGESYRLGETYESEGKVPGFGNTLLDCKLFVSLYQINEEDEFYSLNLLQEIDKEQLLENAYVFFKPTIEDSDEQSPTREDIENFTHKMSLSSSIHTSGWLLHSVQTKTVQSGGVTTIQERTMKLL